MSHKSETCALVGMVFSIAGDLSLLRCDFEKLLRKNGGTIKQQVKQGVTHLICADSHLSKEKAHKARQLGISIIKEEAVHELIRKNDKGKKRPAAKAKPKPKTTTTMVATATNYAPFDPADLVFSDDEDDDAKAPPNKKIKTVVALAELADGGVYEVPGKDYKIKNVGGVYSCNCPAWRFQSKKIDVRTCKHIKELRGEEAEAVRIGGSGVSASESSKKPKSKKSANSSKTSGTAAAKDGSLFDAKQITLAHKWDPSKNKHPSNFLMSEKLDGMRALWNGVELVSRQGNRIDAPDFFLEGFPSDIALDGELFMGRGQFQDTVSITRRQNGGDLWRKISYVVFDSPTIPGGFEDRLEAARKVVANTEFAKILEHTPCRDQNHLDQELERIEKLGGEGLMMREKGSAYQTGRSQKLLKVKTFLDDEAIVRGHEPGKGKHTGRLGALLCELRNGQEFKVGTGFSDAQRENPPAIGQVVTFRYFELTKAGVPRFPTFQRIRPDVAASEFAL